MTPAPRTKGARDRHIASSDASTATAAGPRTAAERADALADLLARVAIGDQRAFAELYRLTSPHLYAVAVRIVRNGAIAEEILQEAFVSIWHHAGTYDMSKSQPITWLTSVVRNRCLDRLRRRELDTESLTRGDDDDAPAWEPPAEGPSPIDMLVASADARALRGCIDALDPGPRQAIALAFFHGMSHAELSAHLREPLGTVKSWVRRALATLRRCLDSQAAQA
ncbi:MAG TPA: sigma-70 family RNA polymerase sigma factor [Casimicrobiaceae bacterium]|nr:sigma-70 family RNA polymerase sigma factor [Casimicrobiaceae bacterium]